MSQNRPPLHRSTWTTEEISDFSQVKRFMERFQGDPVFRERLPKEMQACASEYGFTLDPESLRCMWDVNLKLSLLRGEHPDFPVPPLVAKYRTWIGERLHWRERIRTACAPNEPRWRSWRERQMNRA